MINIINCPCCKKELYRTITQIVGEIPKLAKGSPEHQHDENGNYMICKNCLKRINLVSPENAQSSEVLWDLSDFQPCIDQ
jgi:Trm112p-like protein